VPFTCVVCSLFVHVYPNIHIHTRPVTSLPVCTFVSLSLFPFSLYLPIYLIEILKKNEKKTKKKRNTITIKMDRTSDTSSFRLPLPFALALCLASLSLSLASFSLSLSLCLSIRALPRLLVQHETGHFFSQFSKAILRIHTGNFQLLHYLYQLSQVISARQCAVARSHRDSKSPNHSTSNICSPAMTTPPQLCQRGVPVTACTRRGKAGEIRGDVEQSHIGRPLVYTGRNTTR